MKMFDAGIIIIITVFLTICAIGLISHHFHNAYHVCHDTGSDIDWTPTPPDKR